MDVFPYSLRIFSHHCETRVAYWLRRWIHNLGVPCLKPQGGSKVDSVFHPCEVDKISTRNFWELSGKK